MIAPAKIKEIEILLTEGRLSQRRIARMTGISRATVGAIAAGKRPDYEERRQLRRLEFEDQPLGPPERCAGCGGLVYMPCRLCRVRKIKAQEQAALQFYRKKKREASLRRLVAVLRRSAEQNAA